MYDKQEKTTENVDNKLFWVYYIVEFHVTS